MPSQNSRRLFEPRRILMLPSNRKLSISASLIVAFRGGASPFSAPFPAGTTMCDGRRQAGTRVPWEMTGQDNR